VNLYRVASGNNPAKPYTGSLDLYSIRIVIYLCHLTVLAQGLVILERILKYLLELAYQISP
jgi:hypothetical protein